MTGSGVQRGLSLVELMVGLALGLLLAMVGTAMLVANLRETRRLVLEARLAQELDSAADLVAHDLRRAGHWSEAVDGVRLAGMGPVPRNPYTSIDLGTAGESVSYRYADGTHPDGAPGADEQFGFRLEDTAIEMKLGAGPWQALTDSATLTVTRFRLTPSWRDLSLASFCLAPCASQETDCPPRQRVLSYEVEIEARLVAEPGLARTSTRRVRVRNDAVTGACAK